MNAQELYDLIGLHEEVIEELEKIGRTFGLTDKLEACLKALMEKETAAEAYKQLVELLGEDPGNMKMLYCQLECARRDWERYEKAQIGKQIFVDTMKCFTRFIEECKEKNGRRFFDRGWWTYRQISMQLFRIGTLEFEMVQYEGENAVAVHIPSDGSLAVDAVEESLKGAETFLEIHYPDYGEVKYICDSWLLSPALKTLLPETSNIIRFQNRFQIVKEVPEEKDFIEWLFQMPVDTPYEELPVKTSLQKKARELLLKGGKIGAAYGIMKR